MLQHVIDNLMGAGLAVAVVIAWAWMSLRGVEV